MKALPRGASMALHVYIAALSLFLLPTFAAFINFENCLPESTQRQSFLQFTPYFVDAHFGEQQPHTLDITVYGNVSGHQLQTVPPPGSDTDYWSDDTLVNGKIMNIGVGTGDSQGNFTTLTADYKVLTYTAYENIAEAFCTTLVNDTDFGCPLIPVFEGNASDPDTFPAFFQTHDFGSSYAFSTISATIHVISGDSGAADLACVSAPITPRLGSRIVVLLIWLPAAILILKGVATLSAAVWSPWGSSDIFRWSSNYGRDEDLLRLVTPGFGDCLQYIQFVVLTGSLTLQYPGFYQPAVSQASWSILLFNESFVSGGDGYQSLRDGMYVTNATYGLTRMSQLIGMSFGRDIWACMAIWLLVIAVAVVVFCQLGFLGRWLFRLATKTTEEDLRQKNLPFTLGNMIRLLFNFFILPIVALSLFQLVLSSTSPTSVLVCAVLLLLIMIVWAGWILRVIFSTKPRTLLFDDMPTVLLYGPLYNTYSDSAAPFALVPVFITFMRGVALGAVQPSGIAQIIVLAVCEVILILTLNGFRPFQGQTSMNLYHTFFASVRLVTIILMIAFAPSLGVTEAPKGWIGYVILLLHACVLVFGFFLNSAQTIIEVIARSMGAGGDAHSGAVRGSILNWRMLKKREDRHRRHRADRGSTMSNAAILGAGPRSDTYGARSRSVSGSSNQLLNRMSGFENFSQGGENFSSTDPDMENSRTSGSGANGRPSIAKADGENFYRPPRPRKATVDEMSKPGIKTRSTGEFPYSDSPGGPSGHARDTSYDSGAFQGSPAPAYLRERQGSGDDNGPRTDYAVREVDQYYRGPALNEQANRKLKTGPADPEGPITAAQSWISKLMFGVKGGKKKDQSKGFEVVRSARMPPGMQQEAVAEDLELQTSPVMHQEPYRDAPDTPRVEQPSRSMERTISPTDEISAQPATTELVFGFGSDGATRQTTDRDVAPGNLRPDSDALGHPGLDPISSEHAGAMGVSIPHRQPSEATTASRYTGRRSSIYDDDDEEEDERANTFRYSDQPIPSLAPIEVGGLDLPSRFNSNASRFNANTQTHLTATSGPTRLASYRSAAPSTSAASNIDIADTAGAQDWLRAVDQLDWPNHSRQPSLRSQTPADPNLSTRPMRSPPPSVPRRSSRRTPSQEHAALRYQPHADNMLFEPQAFDPEEQSRSSGASGLFLGQGRRDGAAAPSHRQVSHRRAGDSISRNSTGAAAALRGVEVEVEGEGQFGGGEGEGEGVGGRR